MLYHRHGRNAPAPATGNALIPALLAMTVLLTVGLTTARYVATRHRAAFQSASWEDALRAAESGVDIAASQLNSDVTTTSWSGFTGSTALSNWQAPPYPSMATTPPPAGAYNYRKTSFTATSGNPLAPHAGDGNQALYAVVRIDPLNGTGAMYSQADYNSNAQVWYRVRSTGVAGVPGNSGTAYETSVANTAGQRDHLGMLRRLFYVHDKTNGLIGGTQVSRTVEVIMKPASASLFARSLTTQNTISMSGSSYTDSYDSTDPTKSTGSVINGVYYGLYDQTKRQSHGDIASDSAGTLSDLRNSFVYGSALSNTGNYPNEGNVKGSKITNFDTVLPPVSDPTLPGVVSGPSLIKNTSATLTAGSMATPTNYVLTEFTIGGSNVATIVNPTPGAAAYINIWVKGTMTVSGSSYVVLQSGVHATFWVDGSTTISGSGVSNTDKVPANLIFNGVTPKSGSPPSFTVSGSATFQGVVNAPAFNFVDSGSGDFSGAIIANTANLSGSAGFHYDESLAGKSGGNSVFQMLSWVEDIAQLAPQP